MQPEPNSVDSSSARKCATCQDLAPSVDGGWYVESNPEILKESSENGCRSCSLVVQALEAYHFRGPDAVVRLLHANDRDGFMVKVSRQPGQAEEAIEIFTTDETSLCPWPTVPVRMRAISDPKSIQAFRYFATCIARCLNDHPSCSTKFKNLPGRLLDISGGKVKLCSPTHQPAYACLSHCWGSSNIIKTTKANIEDHKTDIPWTHLPRTFQDAIIAARHFLIGYLWIDSLCIIQDDDEDWRKESACMGDIYSQAIFTIAATGSADGNGGLFHPHPDFPLFDGIFSTSSKPTMFARKKIVHPANMGGEHEHDHDFPLFKRGWIYQERLLSPRVLHFGRHELLWECKISTTCECGFLDDKRQPVGEMIAPGRRLKAVPFSQFHLEWQRMLSDNAFISPEGLAGDVNSTLNIKPIHTYALKKAGANERSKYWRDMVSDFSRLLMSRQSDRLPAFTGIIQQTIPYRKSQCLAGIWLDSFFIDILWSISFERAPFTSTSPTWSWGSVGQYIIFPDYAGFALEPEKVYAKLVSVSSSTKVNRHGMPNYDSLDLHISGQMTDVRLVAGDHHTRPVALEWQGKLIPSPNFSPDSRYWEKDAPRYVELGTKLRALRIASFPDADYSIILNVVSEREKRYERLGIFVSKGISGFPDIFKGDEDYNVVTLI